MAQSEGTDTEYFAYDGLGSVRQVLGESGLPLMAQTFDPYGNPYSYAGPAESVASYGYSGEQTDSNGLVFLRARYYAPSMGRFLNMDPVRGIAAYPLTLNPYLYTLGNPVRYTDPSGEFVVAAIVGGLIIGAITAGIYDVMVNQGKGGWDNVANGNVFDLNHYCDVDWVETAAYATGGAVVGGVTAAAAVAAIPVLQAAGQALSAGATGLNNLSLQAFVAAQNATGLAKAGLTAWLLLDLADDLNVMRIAQQGDPSAQAQVVAMALLLLLPDLPFNSLINFAPDDLSISGGGNGSKSQ